MLPESFLKTQFKIFFSVDIIGSSLHKYVKPSNNYIWYTQFKEFFSFFTTNFMKDETKVWKFLGDEIIFMSNLTEYNDIINHVQNFQRALVTFNTENTDDLRKMKCRGTIWIANFPVYNVEIRPIPKFSPDYIGPSIDAGFRLSKFSTERNLVLSVDAMYMLHQALENTTGHGDSSKPKFITHYHGAVYLKGVYNNELYPVFWIDNYPSRNRYAIIEELNKNKKRESLEIIKDCRDYISFHTSICIPFFTKEEEEMYKPSGYDKCLEKIKKNMEGKDEKDDRPNELPDNEIKPNFIID